MVPGGTVAGVVVTISSLAHTLCRKVFACNNSHTRSARLLIEYVSEHEHKNNVYGFETSSRVNTLLAGRYGRSIQSGRRKPSARGCGRVIAIHSL